MKATIARNTYDTYTFDTIFATDMTTYSPNDGDISLQDGYSGFRSVSEMILTETWACLV